ncbi:DeoR/GlpR family DNA-binding transcription regulator [Marispirochaeta aestuarii]|uniref:DeoR/GlpR family DNA-binding transcription regulator n=1 Tax=Marispirochaeta aestuarii TaxID=1963862 RepID=UPI0029C96FC6|nr:DeoR/GlpR family DNA-binding transcription regulator [Marispirochaeta aestuarii]
MPENIIPIERQHRIQKMITENGIVRISELSKLLNVTELTIRRDLDILEKKGILDRTHGGAILRHRISIEPLYTDKDQINQKEKDAIGKTVNYFIEKGDTVLINTGSTISQVLRNLTCTNIRVITSNACATSYVKNPDIELILTGGVYRPQSNSLIGGFCQMILKQVWGSKAIIGIDGLSIQHGLTTPIQQEAEIGRLMMERTQGPVIVVADHTKMGVVSNFVTAPIDAISMLITDSKTSVDFVKELNRKDIEVIIAEEFLKQHQ